MTYLPPFKLKWTLFNGSGSERAKLTEVIIKCEFCHNDVQSGDLGNVNIDSTEAFCSFFEKEFKCNGCKCVTPFVCIKDARIQLGNGQSVYFKWKDANNNVVNVTVAATAANAANDNELMDALKDKLLDSNGWPLLGSFFFISSNGEGVRPTIAKVGKIVGESEAGTKIAPIAIAVDENSKLYAAVADGRSANHVLALLGGGLTKPMPSVACEWPNSKSSTVLHICKDPDTATVLMQCLQNAREKVTMLKDCKGQTPVQSVKKSVKEIYEKSGSDMV